MKTIVKAILFLFYLLPDPLQGHISNVTKIHWPGLVWGICVAGAVVLAVYLRCVKPTIDAHYAHGEFVREFRIHKGDYGIVVPDELSIKFNHYNVRMTPAKENPDSTRFVFPSFGIINHRKEYVEDSFREGDYYPIYGKYYQYTLNLDDIVIDGGDTTAVFKIYRRSFPDETVP